MRKNQMLINIDDDIDTKFGTIISINRNTRRATIQSESGSTLENLEFFYHCSPGNIDDGPNAFNVGDEILFAKEGSKNFIIGFEDLKPRQCIRPRFFVKVKKEGCFKYYWLNLLNEKGNYELSIKEPIDINILEKMLETPYNNDHRATKAFMVDVGEGEERWVASPHMLIKNRIQQFLPLHYPATELEDPPIIDPLYPIPSFYTPITLLEQGLNHPCPPFRFYCNTGDGIMVWYTTNPTVLESQNFICGIILNLKDNIVKSFIYYPEEADGRDFDKFWCINKVEAEVPYPLMLDVDVLTKDKLDIIMSWQGRPIKYSIDFNSGNTIYTQVNSCNHQIWIGTGTGFDSIPFITLSQTTPDDGPVIEEVTMEIPFIDCSINETYPYYEQKARKYYHGNLKNWDSSYIWNLFDRTISIISTLERVGTIEICEEHICDCVHWGRRCWGYQKNRDIDSSLQQQNVETFIARWVCPNGIYLLNHKSKQYCDGDAWQVMDHGSSVADARNGEMCIWFGFDDPTPEHPLSAASVAKCFFGYDDMPGDNWNRLDIDSVSPWGTTGWKWDRETNQDDRASDILQVYQIDDLIFDKTKFESMYYLDDRATDDSQGIIVAGKDYTKATEYSPENVHDWKIYWAKKEVGYSDITADILAVLEIEKEQLYEIGLV